MKKLGIILLLTALLVAIFSIEAKKKNEGKARPVVVENTYNFGNIRENKGAVSHEFVISNAGTGNLVIYDVTAQCGCTRPEYPKQPIAPGKSAKVKVTYNPLGRPGSFSKNVTVKTNGDPRKVVLKIKGSVIPKDK